MSKRRRHGSACIRCRRLKVKCNIEPGKTQCIRCERADQPCIAITTHSSINNSPDDSHINNNHDEIEDTDWPQHILRSATVQTLVEENLMSLAEIEHMYKIFMNEMTLYLSIAYENQMTLEQNATRRPLTTLAMVITAKLNSSGPSSKSEMLYFFLERVIFEKVVSRNECSIDMTKAMVILLTFSHSVKEPKFGLLYTIAQSMGRTLDLGNNEDCKILINNNASESSRLNALERTRLRVMMATIIRLMGLNTHRSNLSKMVASITQAVDALKSTPLLPVLGRIELCITETVQAANETFELLEDPFINRLREESVKGIVTRFGKKCKEWYNTAEMIAGNNESNLAFLKIIEISQANLLLKIHETALGQTVFGNTTPNADILTEWVLNVKARAEYLIEIFLKYNSKTFIVPRVYYVHPISAICTMIRIRMVCWCWMLDSQSDLMVDVDYWYKKCYDHFQEMSKKSMVASKMMGVLEKVEKWKNLQLYNSTGEDVEIATSLHRLLRDILLLVHDEEGSTGTSSNRSITRDRENEDKVNKLDASKILKTTDDENGIVSIDPAVNLPSIDYESTLKELFGDASFTINRY